jgi:hypothetical protein
METAMNELSIEAKGLIARAVTADGPSPERRARVKRALAAALVGASATVGATGTVAAAGVAGKGALTAASVVTWLGIGAALGTVASAPALVVRLTRSEPSAHVAAPTAAARRAPPTSPEVSIPAAAPVPTLSAEATAAPVVVRSEVRAAASGPPPGPAPSLADETRVLEAAQRELASGRARSALSLLDEHGKRFPSGALGEEGTAVRVLSLCALGRTEEARRIATTFVEGSPRSPLIPRLRGSCALDGRADDKIPAR